jgi:hypothetical protein
MSLYLSHISLNTAPIPFILPPLQPPFRFFQRHATLLPNHCHSPRVLIFPSILHFFNFFVHVTLSFTYLAQYRSDSVHFTTITTAFSLFPTPCDTATHPLPLAHCHSPQLCPCRPVAAALHPVPVARRLPGLSAAAAAAGVAAGSACVSAGHACAAGDIRLYQSGCGCGWHWQWQ